jgi:hypothetical protein
MDNQSNIIVEKTRLQTSAGIGCDFNIPDNYLIYFEKNEVIASNRYIKKNWIVLKNSFSKLGYKFVYMPLLIDAIKDVEEILAFYLPQLSCTNIPLFVKDEYEEMILQQLFKGKGNDVISEIEFPGISYQQNTFDYSSVLDLFEYDGKHNSGFILFKPQNAVIGFSESFDISEESNLDIYFKDLENYLKNLSESDIDLAYDDFCIPSENDSERLDDEAKEIINSIEAKLSSLKDTGQLLLIVPILKRIIESQSQSIDLKSTSRLEIDKQNKILLPYFNKEVELSHLTKSVYFLFLKHPEGISLKELVNYRKELITIYTSVSNQLDHDKMTKSIDDVINLETKAIYTHLSRIKSAFYKIMDTTHANYYVVSGNGDNNRKVILNPSAIDWINTV